MIYYDWKVTKTQLALMFQGRPLQLKGLVSLKARRWLSRDAQPIRGGHCERGLPGIVRPNWAEVAGCTCRGVIDRHETLSPRYAKQIFNCPIKWQGKRTMWNWYTTDGSAGRCLPRAGAEVGGVVLADYHGLAAGAAGAAEGF